MVFHGAQDVVFIDVVAEYCGGAAVAALDGRAGIRGPVQIEPALGRAEGPDAGFDVCAISRPEVLYLYG